MVEVRELEFDVTMENSDYQQAVYYHVLGKNRFASLGMIVVSLLCLFYLGSGIIGVFEISQFIMIICSVYILFVLMMIAFMGYIVRKIKHSDATYLGIERHMKVNEEGIFSQNEFTEKDSEFAWEELYNGEESGKHFFLFSRSGMIIILPKKVLAPEEIPQLRKILSVMMQTNFKTRYK